MRRLLSGNESVEEIRHVLDLARIDEPVLLGAKGLCGLLGRFASGGFSLIDLEKIAELIEMNEKVEFVGENQDLIPTAIFEIANANTVSPTPESGIG